MTRIILCLILFCSNSLWASHPSEAGFTLTELLLETEKSNQEILSAKKILDSQKSEVKKSFAPFYPEVSVEGGPYVTKNKIESESGTLIYGKAEWNLYNGGASKEGMRRAEILKGLEEKRFEKTKSKVLREVTRTYYELLFILESISLKETAIKLNQEQMALAKIKRSSGFTSSSDVLEFDLRHATLSSDLLMLTKEMREHSQELSVLLGRKDGSSVFSVKGHIVRDDKIIDKEQIKKLVLQKNIDLAESTSKLEISMIDREIARAEFLPKVNFDIKVGKIEEEKSKSGSGDYSAMLTFTMPLFSGFSSINSVAAQKDLVESNKYDTSHREISVHANLENIFTEIDTIVERLNIEEKNLVRSEEYYKITLDEYRRGVKNSPDMVGASERLLEAKIRNLEFRKELQLSKLKLYELISGDPSQNIL